MPEGHKTHFWARLHGQRLGGQTLRVSSPQGRFREQAARLDGATLGQVSAAGKHLFYRFGDGLWLHIHLGRYGKFRLSEGADPPPPRGQIRVRMTGDSATLDLTGPTTCELLDRTAYRRVVDRLGPDPLAGGRKSDVWRRVRQSRRPIGALLLDQSVVAGVGNILRAEAMFESGVDPRTPGTSLRPEQFDRLWRSLLRMMRTGAKLGKVIAVTSREAGKPLVRLSPGERLRVYARAQCPRCLGPIASQPLASRKLYFCPRCQAAGPADAPGAPSK